MSMFIPRWARFEGYETRDIRENHTDRIIEIHLHRPHDKDFRCGKCASQLMCKVSQYRLRLRHMPILDFACFLVLHRWQGRCLRCKKDRSERIDFISDSSPHQTKDFTWWLGKLCEISQVSNAADFAGVSAMTAWRADLSQMRLMAKYYKVPQATHISVDEVYARRKGPKGESRNKKFFTIITDLRTRRVIWVSESRDKQALDDFFILIGEKARRKIKVVAMDQHEPYRSSVRQYCPDAKVVWDRFHLMKSFNEAIDTIRKEIASYTKNADLKRLLTGKNRFIFLKRDYRRNSKEKQILDDVIRENDIFIKIEVIKERLYTFFDAGNTKRARYIFEQIGKWIYQLGYRYLIDWWKRLESQWETLSNYFTYTVTTSLSEGINNVIKSLKRRAFGYRNMDYFRLKIMQVCGYLNSRFIPNSEALMRG